MSSKFYASAGAAIALMAFAGVAIAQAPTPTPGEGMPMPTPGGGASMPFTPAPPNTPGPVPIPPPPGAQGPIPTPPAPGVQPPMPMPPTGEAAPQNSGPSTLTIRMTGAAAVGAIAGNTLTGKIDGEDYTIFFNNDGRLTMLVDAEQSQGRWELRGREVCILIQGEDDECYEIEVAGAAATLKEDATTSYRLDIVKGNSKNLPLAAPQRR